MWARIALLVLRATQRIPHTVMMTLSVVSRLVYRSGHNNSTAFHAFLSADQTVFAGFQRTALPCQLQSRNAGSAHQGLRSFRKTQHPTDTYIAKHFQLRQNSTTCRLQLFQNQKQCSSVEQLHQRPDSFARAKHTTV